MSSLWARLYRKLIEQDGVTEWYPLDMTSANCGTCVYWGELDPQEAAGSEDRIGVCRRYPPIGGEIACDPGYVCGEWRGGDA